MNWVLLSFSILLSKTIVVAELFTFRGNSYYTGYGYPYGSHQSRQLLCMSDDPFDAFIWNPNLVWKDSTVAFTDNNQRTSMHLDYVEYNELTCKFNDKSDPCFSRWSKSEAKKWSVVSSLQKPMGPVFDSRWEEFQEYTTFNQKERAFQFITEFGDEGALAVSIRGAANAHFLLCQSHNFAKDFCYWIILGGWGNNATGVRRCENGVGNGAWPGKNSPCTPLHSLHLNQFPLSPSEWRTFVIKWDGITKTISMYDPLKLSLQYTDDESIVETAITNRKFHVFYDNPQDDFPKIYRFHNYNYTFTEEPDTELISPKLIVNDSDDLCLEMLLGLCSDCDVELSILDENGNSLTSKLFSGRSVAQKVEHGLPMWQHAKIHFHDMRIPPKSITMKIVTRLAERPIPNHHWGIANVQRCSPRGALKKISMIAKQDWIDGAWKWPKVTCQKLSYDVQEAMIVDPDRAAESIFQPTVRMNESALCSNQYFGPYCATRCVEFFAENCHSVVMCDEKNCYCTQGLRGRHCDQYCPAASYGYSCSQKCGECSRYTYPDYGNCNIYTGACNGCQEFSEKYLILPYCQMAVDSPPVPLVKILEENRIQVYLPYLENYAKINSSFIFELKERNGTQPTELQGKLIDEPNNKTLSYITATFSHLIPGMQYNIRMLISIHGAYSYEKPKVLEGAWNNVTTTCQSTSHFDVTPNERSLTISHSSDTESSNHCPDSWYTVTLYSASYEQKNASNIFPAEFSNLPPHTRFVIEIIGLDGNLYFKREFWTLEAAPSAVDDLSYVFNEKTEIEIFWKEPASPNGILKGYRIMLYVIGIKENLGQNESDFFRRKIHFAAGICINNVTFQLKQYKGCISKDPKAKDVNLLVRTVSEVSASSTSYVISDLMPYVKYTITISAYNSKPGVEKYLKVDTPSIDTPNEQFVDLSFDPETSVINWQDPNCTTWTGPIGGARLFFTGISPDVSDFQDTYNTRWHRFTLNDTKPQDIHGLETYKVRVHVLREHLSSNYNYEIFSEFEFTTAPSPPPRVENLEIVQVDSQNSLTTLRWQKPLPPTNGHVVGYSIEFVAKNRRMNYIKVNANDTCSLWEHSLCKTVVQPYIKLKFIEVRAINEGVAELGRVNRVPDNREEQEPSEPENVTFEVLTNGIVDLRWHHPWKTGSPMKIFRIRREVKSTDLRENLSRNETISWIDSPISSYQKQYNIRMYLKPSTSYKIDVRGVSRLLGKSASVEVQTISALAFGHVEQPTINYKESQIDLVIPSIINDTKKSIIHIIVIGPSTCQQASLLTDSLRKDVELEYYKTGWLVATFATAEKGNTSFTIGNGDINDGVINCPLVGGSYVIAYLVYESKIFEKMRKPLIWKSKLIHVGPIPRTAHEVWTVPLVLLIIIGAGLAWYFFKKRDKKAPIKVQENSQATALVPIIPPKYQPRISSRQSLLAESRESLSEISKLAPSLDPPPTPKKSDRNDHSSIVKLNEFQDYVKNAIASGHLNKQYEKIPRGQTKPWEYGNLPENKMKNRYANLIAYDETRVILEKLPDDPYSDYINANYIKGYKKNKAYIATQGPKSNTIIDFWRMIWQERVQVICMLTNVLESGKKKCEQYWPEIGKEMNVGDIVVANLSHSTFADYTFRIFHVTRDQETRRIDQLHYTAWPDHGVPQYTQSVATYLKKLLATSMGHGPALIHCSAGIGRTGTIILCDICLRRAAAEGVVDVFGETAAMRNQRANMVDNKQQYLLAHLALVECLLTLPTEIPCNEALPQKIQDYKKQLPLQRQSLEETTWRDEALQSKSITKISDKNYTKCRYPELAAVVGAQLYISRYPTTDDDSNYMFGVYVDSARRKKSYIASQLPLPSTVNDFWRMIAEFKVELIIVLQPPDEEDPTCCSFVPEYDEELKPTPHLTFKGREPMDEDIWTSQKILLTDSSEKPTREQCIKVLCMKGWESGKNKPPPKPMTLVDFWQNAERISRGDGPTVVLCHDGVTNCGLYLALSFLLERMGLERECDVCLAIRAIRRSRPDFCNDLEQFEYLYDAAVIYAACFETYANFT